jgi:hypothetical protein
LRNLSNGPDGSAEIIHSLGMASALFRRVIIVFNFVAYTVFEKRNDDSPDEVNHLNPHVVKELAALRKMAGTMQQDRKTVIRSVEFVFAKHGAEVGKALRAVMKEEWDRWQQQLGNEQVAEMCKKREWLMNDWMSGPPAHCSRVERGRRVDLGFVGSQLVCSAFHAAQITLAREAGARDNARARLKEFGAIVGADVVVTNGEVNVDGQRAACAKASNARAV